MPRKGKKWSKAQRAKFNLTLLEKKKNKVIDKQYAEVPTMADAYKDGQILGLRKEKDELVEHVKRLNDDVRYLETITDIMNGILYLQRNRIRYSLQPMSMVTEKPEY